MNEMTLLSRHRIRNSSPGGLRPSTLPLGHATSVPHNIESSRVSGEETFSFADTPREPSLAVRICRLKNVRFWRLKAVPALKELKTLLWS